MSSLLSEEETAPRAAAFRELVGFLHGTVQPKTAAEILASVVVRGCAVKGERARRTRGAKRDFLVEELRKLEEVVLLPAEEESPLSAESKVLRSDLHEGEGFVETSTKGARTKTGQSEDVQFPSSALPRGSRRAEAWLKLRAVECDGALMLAPGVGVPAGVRPHKRTLLAIASITTMSLSQRLLLLVHTRADDKAVIVYTRDHLAAPLRELQKVMELIRQGAFNPDITRSGRWRNEHDSIEPRDATSGAEDVTSRDQVRAETPQRETWQGRKSCRGTDHRQRRMRRRKEVSRQPAVAKS